MVAKVSKVFAVAVCAFAQSSESSDNYESQMTHANSHDPDDFTQHDSFGENQTSNEVDSWRSLGAGVRSWRRSRIGAERGLGAGAAPLMGGSFISSDSVDSYGHDSFDFNDSRLTDADGSWSSTTADEGDYWSLSVAQAKFQKKFTETEEKLRKCDVYPHPRYGTPSKCKSWDIVEMKCDLNRYQTALDAISSLPNEHTIGDVKKLQLEDKIAGAKCDIEEYVEKSQYQRRKYESRFAELKENKATEEKFTALHFSMQNTRVKYDSKIAEKHAKIEQLSQKLKLLQMPPTEAPTQTLNPEAWSGSSNSTVVPSNSTVGNSTNLTPVFVKPLHILSASTLSQEEATVLII